jgi:hypothetical protein
MNKILGNSWFGKEDNKWENVGLVYSLQRNLSQGG